MNAVVMESVAERTMPVERPMLVTPPATLTPMQLLALAVQNGMPLDTVKELMQMRRELEAEAAAKAFTVALTQFKLKAPKIFKDAHVSFPNSAGSLTEYDHATLGAICEVIIVGLAEQGITHRWDPAQQQGTMKITCILTHVAGHSEKTSMIGPYDPSGGKNPIQAIGSAASYLERYTLLAATGFAPKSKTYDNDGRGTEAAGEDVKYITLDQQTVLRDIANEGGANKAQFLNYMRVSELSEIRADQYQRAKSALESIRDGAEARKQKRSKK